MDGKRIFSKDDGAAKKDNVNNSELTTASPTTRRNNPSSDTYELRESELERQFKKIEEGLRKMQKPPSIPDLHSAITDLQQKHVTTNKRITDLQIEVSRGDDQNTPKQLQSRMEAIGSTLTTQGKQIEHILQKLDDRDAKDAREKRCKRALRKLRRAVKDLQDAIDLDSTDCDEA